MVCSIRKLSWAEFRDRWEPIRRSVFIDEPSSDYIFPFRHRSWEVMPIPDYLFGGLGPLSWMDYDGKCGAYDEYEPILTTLRNRGTDVMLYNPTLKLVVPFNGNEQNRADTDHTRDGITEWENTNFPFEIFSCFDAGPALAREGEDIWTSFPSYFSAEGDWGLQTFWEEVSLLGGTPEFMAEVYRHAGGREAMRQRFIEYDIGCAWALAYYSSGIPQPVPPDGYPFNDKPRKAFYDMIGWDMPAYDMDWVRREWPFLFKSNDEPS